MLRLDFGEATQTENSVALPNELEALVFALAKYLALAKFNG